MSYCENLFNICLNQKIYQKCIYGVILLIFSIIFLIFNLMGFIRMTKIYKKLVYENSILLLCLFQTIIIIIILFFNKIKLII